jgi:hypothetical protein
VEESPEPADGSSRRTGIMVIGRWLRRAAGCSTAGRRPAAQRRRTARSPGRSGCAAAGTRPARRSCVPASSGGGPAVRRLDPTAGDPHLHPAAGEIAAAVAMIVGLVGVALVGAAAPPRAWEGGAGSNGRRRCHSASGSRRSARWSWAGSIPGQSNRCRSPDRKGRPVTAKRPDVVHALGRAWWGWVIQPSRTSAASSRNARRASPSATRPVSVMRYRRRRRPSTTSSRQVNRP